MKVKPKSILLGVLALGVIGSAMPSEDAPEEADEPALIEQSAEIDTESAQPTEPEEKEDAPQEPVETPVTPSVPQAPVQAEETAEPVQEPEKSAEPEITPEQAFREKLMQYAYVGSSGSDKYHYPTCRWTSAINDGNLVHFDTEEEAAAAGYSPCSTCNP